MKSRICLLPLALSVLVATIPELRAQVVADGATNTLSNVTNTITGDVTVGTNGSFTLLMLSTNALLTNSNNGAIGRNTTAKSNEVQLVSPSARWQVGVFLAVGSNGSFNRLVVSNGATARADTAIIGWNASSSNNRALVTGSGSVWSNVNSVFLGFAGPGNQLVVSNGGALRSGFGYVGGNSTSSNNLAVVSGPGSLWTNEIDFQVGNGSAGNQLVVSNGGALRNGHGYVGVNATASNNLALITGAGSVWSNATDLEVGAFSADNQMLVSSGAAVFVARNGFIGSDTNANGNSVAVTDPVTHWLVVSNLYVGSNGAFSSLVVSNGATVGDDFAFLGGSPTSSNNLAVVTGSGSVWSNASSVLLGYYGAGNQLVVSSGATVRGGLVDLGENASASNNLAVVTGPGSVWSNATRVAVGFFGAANQLVVSNGGVLLSNDGELGHFTSSINNLAMLTGSGSAWTNKLDLNIGENGALNRLVVSNGATLLSSNGFLGLNALSSNNSAIVTGAGSLWTNRLELHVGYTGSGNQLAISNGAGVWTSHGWISGDVGNSNVVVVTGAGSFWNLPDVLNNGMHVGGGGSGNRLVIIDGASVRSDLADIGLADPASNNEALVTGTGSVWTNSHNFYVGYDGNRSRLVVSNSGLVAVGGQFLVGHDFAFVAATNHRATVDGGTLRVANPATNASLGVFRGTNVLNAGLIDVDQLLLPRPQGFFEFNGGTLITRGAFISNGVPFAVGRGNTAPAIWDVRTGVTNYLLATRLIVGSNSSFNQVFVTNGAILDGKADTFLAFSSGSNNEVVVSGPGSTLNSPNQMYIGASGNANRMTIANGGKVFANTSVAGSSIGQNVGTRSNAVMVTDSGSSWSVNDFLYVGSGGNANQLVVSNGATVNSLIGYVGSATSASNNVAIVTGANSSWSNRSDLNVGSSASGNLLVVASGGSVINTNAYVGLSSSTRSNTVLVTGPGAVWNNRGDLYSAYDGSSNQVTVANGGTLISSNAFIGFSALAGFNNALVTGAGTLWSNREYLYVGDDGFNNQLTVSEGAKVASVFCHVGYGVNSKSNVLLVTDPGSLLTNSVLAFVGQAGFGNQLVVSNGGQVVGVDCDFYVGESSTNNLGLVTDPGSLWIGDDIIVGTSSGGNRIVATNGGHIVDQRGTLGYFSSSSNNQALVTGAGSGWTNLAILYLGRGGSGNRMVATNGGFVQSGFAYIGNDPESSNNEATVTGPASLWNSTFSVEIGLSGSRNRLVVTNGGAVTVGKTNFNAGSTGLLVGSAASSTNNRVIVDGGAVRVFASSVGAALDVRRGTNVLNTGVIDVDLLRLTNTQGFFEFNGGTLITRGAFISNGTSFVVGTSGTTPAVWDLRTGSSNHVLSVDLYVGNNSSFNKLLITNGATLTNSTFAILGAQNVAKSNSVTVAGAGSRCFLTEVVVGSGGSFNQVVVSNGGSLNSTASLGVLPTSTNNQVIITGAGSTWTNLGQLEVGDFGSGNQLLVSEGGRVVSSTNVSIGTENGTNNMAVVTDVGSVWTVDALSVGVKGSRSQLQVTNGGLVTAGKSVFMGTVNTSTNNSMLVDNGTVLVTNATGTGLLDLRRGTVTLKSGLVEVDQLLVTNSLGSFVLNGGTLSSRSTTMSSGNFLNVGNNVGSATFLLAGNGTHVFGSLEINANSFLIGNGTVGGAVVLDNGGTISPGTSIGKMTFTNSPFLFGTILMEISKNGATLTNDQLQVTTTLNYNGTLTVTNIGPASLAAGDKFKLFGATFFSGSFSSINLPPLPTGLTWLNKLLVDGSIEVFAPAAISMSSLAFSGAPDAVRVYTQNFDSLVSSGSDVWRDDSTLLGWYAAKSNPPPNFTTYVASDGSDNGGAIYSYGSTGSTDRALGALPINGTGEIAYGLVFTNDTGSSVSNFTIAYTGEQWRNGGSRTNLLTFWYRISPTAITNPEPAIFTNWTPVTALNFESPTLVTPNPFALDGNQSTNRQVFSPVLITGLRLPPSQNIFFRWHDVNDSGADEGMGVDDLTLTFGPLAPQITSVIANPTNGFTQITGQGESNVTYGIEAASNLLSPILWQRISSNTADNVGVFQFTDTNAPSFPTRFYRALYP